MKLTTLIAFQLASNGGGRGGGEVKESYTDCCSSSISLFDSE